MTDIIHLLPDSVANQIAAGEVIQRPASVIKELVENSIDAGASSVQIIIKDAGRTLIQVIDDGCGMSAMDARMSFQRHATSKINTASDLFSLQTMGFRGEALPSIAAVSDIEMRTKRHDDVTGTCIMISASNVESQEPAVCSPGTNIMVKRLFYNLPARRKFLKKDPVEMGHISREFERLALVNTNIEFTLVSNENTIHKLQPASFKQRICDLFSNKLDHQIIPIGTETSLVRIDGYIGLPQHAKRRGALQYFFVNGRYMRHPYFHKAVINCYEDLIPGDTQPCYFINLNVDPETIDVNIHPQKYEIKFENEQPIWQILSATIKESLGRFNASSAINFDTIDAPDLPPFNPREAGGELPELDVDLHYNPFKQENRTHNDRQQSYSRPIKSNSVPTDWEQLYEGFVRKASTTPEEKNETLHSSLLNNVANVDYDDSLNADTPQLIKAEAEVPSMMQLKGKYIVMPSQAGLMFIDQHNAHIRILYEKYIDIYTHGEPASQMLIFPDSLSLTASQDMVLSSICDMLDSMGFDIKNTNGTEWAINSVPAFLANVKPTDAVTAIIDAVCDEEENIEQSHWQKIALAMAKSAAIKYGASLTQPEMDAIVTNLFKLPTPDYTPDGKPIVRIIDMESINKLF